MTYWSLSLISLYYSHYSQANTPATGGTSPTPSRGSFHCVWHQFICRYRHLLFIHLGLKLFSLAQTQFLFGFSCSHPFSVSHVSLGFWTWSTYFLGLFLSHIDSTYKHILVLIIDYPFASTCTHALYMYSICSLSAVLWPCSLTATGGAHTQPVVVMEGPLLDKTKSRSRDEYTYS